MPPSSRRTAPRRIAPVLAGLLLVACADPNEVFQGVWTAEEAYAGLVQGVPRLAMGHYGLEVAGVAWFPRVQGGSVLEEACPCAYIDQGRVDVGAGEVAFATSCDTTTLVWDLALRNGRTDVIDGVVRRADGQPGEQLVTLVRESQFVSDDLRDCPAELR